MDGGISYRTQAVVMEHEARSHGGDVGISVTETGSLYMAKSMDSIA